MITPEEYPHLSWNHYILTYDIGQDREARKALDKWIKVENNPDSVRLSESCYLVRTPSNQGAHLILNPLVEKLEEPDKLVLISLNVQGPPNRDRSCIIFRFGQDLEKELQEKFPYVLCLL